MVRLERSPIRFDLWISINEGFPSPSMGEGTGGKQGAVEMLPTPSPLPQRGREFESLETKRSLSPQGREGEKEERSGNSLPSHQLPFVPGTRADSLLGHGTRHTPDSQSSKVSPTGQGRWAAAPCHCAMAQCDSGDSSNTCEPLSREIPACSRERTLPASPDGP